MKYPDTYTTSKSQSDDVPDLPVSRMEWKITKFESCKFSESSTLGVQMRAVLRNENTMKVETKWMDEEKCQDMDGYYDAFTAYEETSGKCAETSLLS